MGVINSEMGNGETDVGKGKNGLIKLKMQKDKKFVGGKIKTLKALFLDE